VVGPPAAASIGAGAGVAFAIGLMIDGNGVLRGALERILLALGTGVLVVAAVSGGPLAVLLWAAAAVQLMVLPIRPRRRQQREFSWRSDWTPVPVDDGRVEIGAASVITPGDWAAWRLADGTGGDQTVVVHPPGRRFGIPVPGLILAVAPVEGSLDGALDGVLRQRLPGDAPIELDNLRRSQLWIGGEPATMIEGDLRIRHDRLPGPGFAWRLGMWVAGIGPVRGAVAFVDRDGVRHGIGWVAWAGAEDAAHDAFGDAVATWHWASS
jgi:hypothetical protein